MAYISQLDEEEQKRLNPGTDASAPVADVAAPASSSAAPAQSKFVGFSRYLNANRGMAQQAANNLASAIDRKGEAVTGGVAADQRQFNQGVQAGTSTYKQQSAPKEPTGPQPVQFVAPRPQPMATAAPKAYSGPSSLAQSASNWADLQQKGTAVQDAANMTKDAGGLGAEIQAHTHQPYTAGERQFDQGIIGNAGADRFAQSRGRWGKLSDWLNTQNTASIHAADAARGKSQGAVDAYGREQQAAADAAQAATDQQAAANTQSWTDVWNKIGNGQQPKDWHGKPFGGDSKPDASDPQWAAVLKDAHLPPEVYANMSDADARDFFLHYYKDGDKASHWLNWWYGQQGQAPGQVRQ